MDISFLEPGGKLGLRIVCNGGGVVIVSGKKSSLLFSRLGKYNKIRRMSARMAVFACIVTATTAAIK
jgi:hypothetical protein